MSVDTKLELLKYKIKILTTIVASDEHPFLCSYLTMSLLKNKLIL